MRTITEQSTKAFYSKGTLKKQNSEVLASLHASQKKENTFFEDIAPELENLFNN